MGRNGRKEGELMDLDEIVGQAIGFIGQYNHTIDAKGRLIIPARYRDMLGSEFVLTKGMDGCLFAMPAGEFSKLVRELMELPLNSKDGRALTRHFCAGAAKCELDKQGRILVNAELRAAAGLEKEVVLVGVMNRVEIWDKEAWEKNEESIDMDEIERHLEERNISI